MTDSWRKSFVATSVALGMGVDDALGALAPLDPDDTTTILAGRLRAPDRATRANALAAAIHEVVLAVDEARLR